MQLFSIDSRQYLTLYFLRRGERFIPISFLAASRRHRSFWKTFKDSGKMWWWLSMLLLLTLYLCQKRRIVNLMIFECSRPSFQWSRTVVPLTDRLFFDYYSVSSFSFYVGPSVLVVCFFLCILPIYHQLYYTVHMEENFKPASISLSAFRSNFNDNSKKHNLIYTISYHLESSIAVVETLREV